MKNFTLINKKEGETPFEALEIFREKISRREKEYKTAKMTYAGRLDPMASGLLIVLAGEETKNKEKYLALDKEYEFEVLFGFSTDTYDILGKVTYYNMISGVVVSNYKYEYELEKNIKQNLKYFTGDFIQKYPMYSSKTVNGRPLFDYARSGDDVEIPTKTVNIKSLKITKARDISNIQLLANIERRIKKVKGDFRQEEILNIWRKYLRNSVGKHTIVSFKIKCSSGTYVRGIAHELGEKIGLPALAFSIKRTKIGKWTESGVK